MTKDMADDNTPMNAPGTVSVNKILADIKQQIEAPAPQPEPVTVNVTIAVASSVDPMEAGVNSIRADDPDAIIMWSVRGPKQQQGSEVQWILTEGDVIIIHQLASGRFKVYR